MARLTGLEPATPGVTGRYSNQLNYRSVLVCRAKLLLRTTSRAFDYALLFLASPRGFEPLYSP